MISGGILGAIGNTRAVVSIEPAFSSDECWSGVEMYRYFIYISSDRYVSNLRPLHQANRNHHRNHWKTQLSWRLSEKSDEQMWRMCPEGAHLCFLSRYSCSKLAISCACRRCWLYWKTNRLYGYCCKWFSWIFLAFSVLLLISSSTSLT